MALTTFVGPVPRFAGQCFHPAGQNGRIKVAPASKIGKLSRSRRLYTPENPILTLDSSAKIQLLERIEGMARAKDARVKQVMAGLAGEYDVVLVARADGKLAADVRPLIRLSLTVIVEQKIGGTVRR